MSPSWTCLRTCCVVLLQYLILQKARICDLISLRRKLIVWCNEYNDADYQACNIWRLQTYNHLATCYFSRFLNGPLLAFRVTYLRFIHEHNCRGPLLLTHTDMSAWRSNNLRIKHWYTFVYPSPDFSDGLKHHHHRRRRRRRRHRHRRQHNKF